MDTHQCHIEALLFKSYVTNTLVTDGVVYQKMWVHCSSGSILVHFPGIGFIIQSGFWEQDYPTRDLDMQHAQRPTIIGEAMHEWDSDHCLKELRTDM